MRGKLRFHTILPQAPNFIAGKSARVPRTLVFWSEGIRMALQIGDEAPDFDLPACTGEREHRVKLSDFRGQKNVVIVFHPLDWTPT